jgi:hypothetical protein
MFGNWKSIQSIAFKLDLQVNDDDESIFYRNCDDQKLDGNFIGYMDTKLDFKLNQFNVLCIRSYSQINFYFYSLHFLF